jgi:hypothetical protein
MPMGELWTAVGLAVMATTAQAGGFAPLDGPGVAVGAAVATVEREPTSLEWLRYVYPKIGRNVVVPTTTGTSVRTIEWRHPVEVRVRTESGAALTGPEQAAIRDLALVCDRGRVREVSTRTEMNGTFVVNYGCVWLQGYDDQ